MYGIIGYPITHSFSPAYFAEKFRLLGIRTEYQAFALEDLREFPALLRAHPELKGLNVTIPYKEAIRSFLDETDEVAAAVGAINTIKIEKGKLKGYNTDVIGFSRALQPLLQAHHDRALVLGTGGAAKAVQYVLAALQIPVQLVSRQAGPGMLVYEELSPKLVVQHHLIINTTPLGMWPHIDACPLLPYEALSARHLLYDLIYNPEQTLFLQQGAARGATTANGYGMLVQQAEAAWAIWQGEEG